MVTTNTVHVQYKICSTPLYETSSSANSTCYCYAQCTYC